MPVPDLFRDKISSPDNGVETRSLQTGQLLALVVVSDDVVVNMKKEPRHTLLQ
jgi:hypothetical protein